MQTCFVGDSALDCRLALFADASFAGDLTDSKSTSDNYLVLMGPNTFVPLSWMCKKQGVISHSSSEAEVVSLETAVRMEGIPALTLWEIIINTLHPEKSRKVSSGSPSSFVDKPKTNDPLANVDFVPCTYPPPGSRAIMSIMEDNDAVIKMTIKRRSPNMRHVQRTHRINLDSLFERVNEDLSLIHISRCRRPI